jgi:hypothetical protein
MRSQNNPKRTSSLPFLAIPLAFLLIGISPARSQEATESGIVKGKTPQGYSYMSGGVGVEERDE